LSAGADGLPRRSVCLPRSLGKEEYLNREEKKESVAYLKERFARAKAVVLTDYKGITVAEISDARRKLRSANVEYKVVKNTLAKIAAGDTPVSVARDYFDGPTGVAIGFDDPVSIVRSVLDYSKENAKLVVKCGVIEGTLVQEKDLKKIAHLPSREVLLSMMAGAFTAPASKLAAGLNATVVRLAYALSALKSRKTE
jgi:large subunit ribosomal protein L10